MAVAVLSDIHSNYIALETCIDYALSKNIRTFIFLGDYIGEMAYPEKTMERIYALSADYECYFIKGNKEDYWIDYQNNRFLWLDNDSTTGCLLYAYKHLSQRDLDFFKGLPISQNITLGDMPQITICHGSPYKTNENLFPANDKTFDIMEGLDSSVILCGHTHIQGKIENKGKMVLNAGAVGLPMNSNRKSQFLILHEMDNQWKEEFVSLEYDVERVIEEIRASGLHNHAPYWCMVTENLLRNGNIPHSTVLKRAMSLCDDETGNCIWPNVPEKYWKQAVEEMMCTQQD